jgi:hypothetical protein
MTSGAIGVAIASGNGIFGRPQIIIAGAKLQADNRVAFARPRRVIARRGRANAIKPSLPGSPRQSILFKRNVLRRWMDARIKSGHDAHAHTPDLRIRFRDLAAQAREVCPSMSALEDNRGRRGCRMRNAPAAACAERKHRR